MIKWKLQYLIKWKDFSANHNTWEPWDNMHAPELVADFHWKYPGAARHIQAVKFDLIKFRPVPMTITPRHRFSGGRWMLGDPHHWTFLPSPLPCPCLSTSHLTIITPSLYHPHPSTVSLPSTHHHLVIFSLFPLSYHHLYLPFFVFTYIVRGQLMIGEKVMPEIKLISRCRPKDDTCCLIYKRTYVYTLSPDRRYVK